MWLSSVKKDRETHRLPQIDVKKIIDVGAGAIAL
jgi:hypothetical protein